ncbi:MAG: DUF5050 domain-containing protein [Clostridia bacterium]|nr:DUF5050 domain-containing protein [Clostridia bacterium]
MKKIALILSLVFALAISLFLGACGSSDNSGNGGGTGTENSGSTGNGGGAQTPAPSTFTGITFTDKTVTYDGSEYALTVGGTLPEGTQVSYTNNKGTNAGVYNATATLTKEGYTTLNLSAKLTINKAEFTSSTVTLSDLTVEYDSLPHSLQVVGNLPADAQVTYKYNGVEAESVTQVGTYSVECIIESTNYLTITRTAKLKITTTEEQLYSAYSNGKLYFQNNLDGNKLYVVDGSTVKKVNNDVPEYMISDGTSLYYYSTSLFTKVIKSYSTVSTTLYGTSGEYLVTDGTYIYYAINNLLINTSKNGIYRYKLDGSQEAVRLTTDKAEYLVYYGGNIYYSNKSEGGKLYKISASATEGTGNLVFDKKVSYIINDGGTLYFDGSNGLAKAIYKYNVTSATAVKLTTDAGKYLTKVGNYIYYVNNDLLTSNIFGDGIYRVSTQTNSDSSMPGEKVISAEDNGYSSLSSDGTYLYFYKLNDKHFYKFNVSTKQETDLMVNFVPVDDTALTGYSCLAEYNGEIYYTNPLDDGCLYKYSPSTKNKFKVLADSVSNVYFYNGYMYYSTYIATNYALFRMDMSTGESTKINSSRCENLIFDGDTIYYVKIGVPGTHTNYIMKMDLDGQNVTELYTGKNLNITGFEKVGDNIYFVINPAVGYKYIYKYNVSDGSNENLDIKAQDIAVYNNKIYYYAHTDKALKACNLDGSNITQIKADVEINDMYAYNGVIYFSSNSNKNTGFYAYDIASGQIKTISTKQANGIVAYGGKVYFLQSDVSYTTDYPSQNAALDGRLYCYDGTSVTKVA